MAEEIVEKVQFSEFQRHHGLDLDLDLKSGYTAYRRASVIDLYVHTKFHWNRTDFLRTDVRTDGRIYWRTDISPLMLLGRIGGVDLQCRLWVRKSVKIVFCPAIFVGQLWTPHRT